MEGSIETIRSELVQDRVKINVEHELNKFEVERLLIKERQALQRQNEERLAKELAKAKEILQQEFEFKVQAQETKFVVKEEEMQRL